MKNMKYVQLHKTKKRAACKNTAQTQLKNDDRFFSDNMLQQHVTQHKKKK